ncbi:hypothetical protein A9310_19935 [Gordonia sp. UCD-TK1]|nr:hypothetical protein A9310_19935 [Gordonia sp. UCD-TK1]
MCVEATSLDPSIEEVEEFDQLVFFGAVVGAGLGLSAEGVEACAEWSPSWTSVGANSFFRR